MSAAHRNCGTFQFQVNFYGIFSFLRAPGTLRILIPRQRVNYFPSRLPLFLSVNWLDSIAGFCRSIISFARPFDAFTGRRVILGDKY